MKLELKHVLPYINYGLKCRTPNMGDLIVSKIELTSRWKIWFNYRYGSKNKFEKYNYENVKNNVSTVGKGFLLSKIKPILRPMSDLINEIENDGVTFIPLVKYVESLGEPVYDFNEYELTDYEHAVLNIMISYESRTHDMYDFLVKNKFDIFDLIPNDLAIDINTLQDGK